MSVQEVLLSQIKNYVGLSSDSKPIDCAISSTFLETDTKLKYKFDGLAWINIATTVKFDSAVVSASITRPSDTNQYDINDVLSNSTSSPAVLTFNSIGNSNNQKIYITGAMATSTAKQTTLPAIDLWLFKISPTAENDNTAFAISDTENDNVVAVLEFDCWKYSANNSRSDIHTINVPIQLGVADTKLYAIPVLKNTYTPVSGEIFKFTIKVDRQ